MKSINPGLLLVSVSLLSGILLGAYALSAHWVLWILIGLFSVCYTLFRVEAMSSYRIHLLLLCLLCVCTGILRYHSTHPLRHYRHLEKATDSLHYLTLKTEKLLWKTPAHHSYLASVLAVNGQAVHGKVLLRLPASYLNSRTDASAILHTTATPYPIPESEPGASFPLGAILSAMDAYHQLSPAPGELFRVPPSRTGQDKMATGLRNKLITRLWEMPAGEDLKGLIQALLLADRSAMSPKVLQAFRKSGLAHVLAFSGLHLSIITGILLLCCYPLRWLPQGKKVQKLCAVLLLWWFVSFLGGGPSLARAATMCSFAVLAYSLRRTQGIQNALLASFAVLLYLFPRYLFQAAFQLSFLALSGILTLQPGLAALWKPKLRPIRYLWQLTCASFSAQLFVFPLSLYYFGELPLHFLASNLLVLPLLPLLLGSGMIILLLLYLQHCPEILFQTYVSSLNYIVKVMVWLASQEHLIFRSRPGKPTELLLIYLMLALSVAMLYHYTRLKRNLLLLTLILMLGNHLNEVRRLMGSSELRIEHRIAASSWSYRQGRSEKHYSDAKTPQVPAQTSLLPLPDGSLFLVIDSLGIYPATTGGNYRILLKNSPEIHLEKLIRDLRPIEIIADGSNYPSFIRRWKGSCKKTKLPFHSTGEKGVYMIRWP